MWNILLSGWWRSARKQAAFFVVQIVNFLSMHCLTIIRLLRCSSLLLLLFQLEQLPWVRPWFHLDTSTGWIRPNNEFAEQSSTVHAKCNSVGNPRCHDYCNISDVELLSRIPFDFKVSSSSCGLRCTYAGDNWCLGEWVYVVSRAAQLTYKSRLNCSALLGNRRGDAYVLSTYASTWPVAT